MPIAPSTAADRSGRRWATARIRAASANPASAVRKPRALAPSKDATGSSGPSACEKATPPQGNPPNGNLARSASPVIQAAAAHTGQAGSRRDAAAASAPTGAVSSASATASAIHGRFPTYTFVKVSSGR